MTANRMTPEQRTLRAKMAAHRLHATRDGREITANARQAFMDRFEKQVDPDGILPVPERARRAEHARKAYFTELALKSSKVRRQRSTK